MRDGQRAAAPCVASRAASCLVALMLVLLLAACGGGGSGFVQPPAAAGAPYTATFHVNDTAGFDVAGALVYLVPAGDIDDSPFNADDVRTGASENRDEPLEDAIRNNGAGYLKALTDAAGLATITGIPESRFFWFVMPHGTDTEHLPGGCGCRLSRDALTLAVGTNEITLSSQPSPAATYLGSTTCLVCHSSYDTQKTHAHRLGFAVPGQLSGLQDTSRYPDYKSNWDAFLPANDYTGGTTVWMSDFTPSRGFDKFVATTTAPMPPAVVYVKAYLWKDNNDSKYKITLENVHPMAGVPAMTAPPNIWTLTVELTYGGAVYKQRNLVSILGRKGRYPLLQYQSEGNDGRYDRTRKQFRDYHLDWYWNDAAKTFQYPATTKNFEANCVACHITGFERYVDPMTGEAMSRGVPDVNGAFDLDGDGTPEEINTGCEVCHGPGSEHAAWASQPANANRAARYVVKPDYLSPSRNMQICGRCHDRQSGQGSVVNDEPLNSMNQMPPPGISRHDYLASYITRKGPKASSMWSDGLHSKSHHQQYSDMLKSTKYRNSRWLVTCADCHDSHGKGAFENHLKANPSDPVSGLCAQCHAKDLTQHMLAQTGATHAGGATTCAKCHMPKTAKTGSGRYGNLLATPNGTSGDAAIAYFENDIASHLFGAIARKYHPNVDGDLPINAMPIPYTNSCGQPCHTAGTLQFKPLFPIGVYREDAQAAK